MNPELQKYIQILSDPVQGTNTLYRIEKKLIKEIKVRRSFRYNDRSLAELLFKQISSIAIEMPNAGVYFEEQNGRYWIQLEIDLRFV